jgi:hypothetical protein
MFEWSCTHRILCVHQRMVFLMHTGKQYACTRRIDLVCDARMIAGTIVLRDQYTSVQLFELLPVLRVVLKGES